jgi:hypothetical protein
MAESELHSNDEQLIQGLLIISCSHHIKPLSLIESESNYCYYYNCIHLIKIIIENRNNNEIKSEAKRKPRIRTKTP